MSTIDECSLLNPEELQVIGNYEDGASRVVGTGRVCEWKEVQDVETGDSAVLTATIRENGGLETINDLGSGIQVGTVSNSSREVAQTWSDDVCVMAMAVGEGQRVEVAMSKMGGGLSGEAACQPVGEVVELIDPKLPLG